MKFFLRGSALIFVLVGLLPASAQTPSGREVVTASAVTSFDPVARGGSFQLAVILKIRPGYHINAREVSAEYLIPTDLRVEAPEGFKASEVTYPKGTLRSFTFSKTPLNVYQGNAILLVKLSAPPAATLGVQHVPLKLRYQACSEEICLPPVKVDVDAKFTVVSKPSEAKPTNAEFFKESGSLR
jgi:uncharacterized protein